MNKKKLSVVMAGAMLASSVSPVLAATESKVDQNELGSLVSKVYDKLTTGKLYSDTSSKSAEEKLGEDVNGSVIANTSVYDVKIDGATVKCTDGAEINTLDLTTDAGKSKLKLALQEAFKELTAGQKVEIVSRGFVEVEGYTLASEKVESKYVAADFNGATTNQNTLSKSIYESLAAYKAGTYDSPTGNPVTVLVKDKDSDGKKQVFVDANTTGTKISIYFNEDVKNITGTKKVEVNTSNSSQHNTLADGTYNVLEITADQKKLDFSRVTLSDGTIKFVKDLVVSDADKITGFPVATTYQPVANKPVEETIEITGKENNLKTDDLYDGLMLTTEGHDLLNVVKEARKKSNIKYSVDFKSIDGTDIPENADSATLGLYKGEYGFTITIKDAFGKTTVYTVKGAKKATETLAGWLNSESPKVDILAGANRYATAVQIAKEQIDLEKFVDRDKTADIVLVNGEALVDGLAAAPLAAQLSKYNATASNDNTTVPVLLTEAGSLRKETKAYIKELLYNKSQSDLKDHDVTVHLVGGRTVLSTAVENELKDMGLKIKRYNGDNREETSLKVADKILELQGTDTTNRFVVGADGEADAMSISPIAATIDTNGNATPIIVSKRGGLTDEALAATAGKTVTVIGGEGVVSKADYEALEENVGANGEVRRIFGENRQGTNAAIIKEYYQNYGANNLGINDVKSVVVAKDGKEDRDELVDALTAANLAAYKNAPIVLAKSSLSAEQMDAINLRAQSSKSLYQVGIGVERPVVETLAKALGLSNLK